MPTHIPTKDLIKHFLNDVENILPGKQNLTLEDIIGYLSETWKVADMKDFIQAEDYVNHLIKDHFGNNGIDYFRFYSGEMRGQKTAKLIMLKIFISGWQHKFIFPHVAEKNTEREDNVIA